MLKPIVWTSLHVWALLVASAILFFLVSLVSKISSLNVRLKLLEKERMDRVRAQDEKAYLALKRAFADNVKEAIAKGMLEDPATIDRLYSFLDVMEKSNKGLATNNTNKHELRG